MDTTDLYGLFDLIRVIRGKKIFTTAKQRTQRNQIILFYNF